MYKRQVITLVAGTFAWFTSNKQLVNTLKTNTNDVTIVEEFDPEKPFTPGIDFTKKVAAQNKGEEMCIRDSSIGPFLSIKK